MTENQAIPYLRIPRTLWDDPVWEELSLIQQHVFHIIFKHVCYSSRKHDDHGHIIELEPGQMCATIRQIQALCHASISKNDVERSIKKLILVDFLRQEVRHHKSIITISHRDTYELIKKASETRSETTLRQDRDNFETEKKKGKKVKKEKKDRIIVPNDSAAAESSEPAKLKIVFSFQKNSFENIQPDQILAWQLAYPGLNIHEELLRMQEWILANRERAPKSNFQAFIVRWLTRGQNNLSARAQIQKPDSRAIMNGKRQTEYDHAY